MIELCNRAQARLALRQRYYTGEPCRNGHIAERYTSTGGCLGCMGKGTKANRSRLPTITMKTYLRVPMSITPGQRAALVLYLQDACVPAFFAGAAP